MSGYLRATILGCGSSGGVPRANGDWGRCDPANPKNRRRRCSLLVERAADKAAMDAGEAVTRIVVDTAPDFREQMLSAQIPHIDAVLLTHDHADQTHGMDDLRAFAMSQRQRIPVWMDEATAQSLFVRFGYAYNAKPGSPYPSILERRVMPDFGQTLEIDSAGGKIQIIPFDQEHGSIRSLGFRFGDIAYSADVSAIPDASYEIVNGVTCWIIDALRETPHPTHFSVGDAVAAIDRIKARHGILTNLHITLDYDTLSQQLPNHVRCAHDGLQIASEGGAIEFS
jgi:phosphoribosyl 1,2-cyclic phosphate phosphodiesterase